MKAQQNLQTSKSKLDISFLFLSLSTLIALITSVVSFLNLIFSTLDKQFPDVLNSTYQYGYSIYDFESIRSSLAILIIFFPIFIAVSFFWKRFKESEMSHIDETIKKIFIYIILFISAIVVAIDLVTLVRYFVSGEITNRFIYKVLSTLVVVLLVGVYYLLLIRKNKEPLLKTEIIFASVSIIIVIVAIIYSFSIMGSPKKQRLLRLDDKRVTDLQNIQYQIINYWQQKEKLPENLSDLSSPMSGYSIPTPPLFSNGEKYEYKITDNTKLSFELCADFALPIPMGSREGQDYYGGGTFSMMDKSMSTNTDRPFGGMNESWDHQTGRTCFPRTIDVDIYPPYPKPVK